MDDSDFVMMRSYERLRLRGMFVSPVVRACEGLSDEDFADICAWYHGRTSSYLM